MSDHDSIGPGRRNGSSFDVRTLLQWIPLAAVIVTAGAQYNELGNVRNEVVTARARLERVADDQSEDQRALAVLGGRVERSERDQGAVADKLDRLSEQSNQMNRRLDALCAALGKDCKP